MAASLLNKNYEKESKNINNISVYFYRLYCILHGSNFSRYNFKLNNETRKRFDSSSICNGCLLNNNFNFRNKVKKEQ